jgi:hypothetical protein
MQFNFELYEIQKDNSFLRIDTVSCMETAPSFPRSSTVQVRRPITVSAPLSPPHLEIRCVSLHTLPIMLQRMLLRQQPAARQAVRGFATKIAPFHIAIPVHDLQAGELHECEQFAVSASFH